MNKSNLAKALGFDPDEIDINTPPVAILNFCDEEVRKMLPEIEGKDPDILLIHAMVIALCGQSLLTGMKGQSVVQQVAKTMEEMEATMEYVEHLDGGGDVQ